ncbi:MAG: EF-hand domain-containing protein [Candidatus Competibacteraceae bacterium]
MKTLTKLTVTLLTSLALSAAFAQGFNMKTAEMMDENHDGMITKEEYMKHSKDMAAFDKMDTNKDGVLDANEIRIGFNQK